ncbi:MAG: glutamine synthetase family protein [Acidiferrobacterales bacterium]|nr:glutamine synthetase family protein [Acidiferrobacterales bacterium]
MNDKKLRVLFCDHLNLARGKYLPGNLASGESRFCQGVYALAYDKELLPAPCSMLLEGLPDMVVRYDASEARKGWLGDESVVIADQFDSCGNSLAVDGRTLLRNTVGQWHEIGYQVKVGIELEAYAFTRDADGNWSPYDTPGAFVYGTGPFIDPLELTDRIFHQAEVCGFPLEMITSEFDSPQFEFTLRYADALTAADDIFLFRLMAREIAIRDGVLLTFMPKPIPQLSGSGVHINFSLWDAQGTNAIGDAGAADKLSDLGRRCVAGLMHHHRAMAGLLAPTVNSYMRLQPASLSGYWRNWGEDHRGVTTRISSETGDQARIEHRMADGAVNPYTATATVLQAARLGYEKGYDLPPAETADCLENHDATQGVPDDLGAALAELKADTDLVDAVGAELVGNLAVIKEYELESTADMDQRQLRDYYIHYI